MNWHQRLESLLQSVEVQPVSLSGAVNGAGVDMAGWDGVAFVAQVGVVTGAGTFDLRVVESANANFSGAVNISGASITQVTTSNTTHTIDVWRPTNRYLRVVATQAVNTVLAAVLAFRYRGQSRLPASTPTNFQYVKVQAN